jgi:hypothetical protein
MIHRLKTKSSFIVVVLASLQHKACVFCGKPIHSLEESSRHWNTVKLEIGGYVPKHIKRKKNKIKLEPILV